MNISCQDLEQLFTTTVLSTFRAKLLTSRARIRIWSSCKNTSARIYSTAVVDNPAVYLAAVELAAVF